MMPDRKFADSPKSVYTQFFHNLLCKYVGSATLFSVNISNIKHQTSNIKHQTSNIKHQTSNIQHQTSNIKHPTSNIKHQTSNIQHQTSNIIPL